MKVRALPGSAITAETVRPPTKLVAQLSGLGNATWIGGSSFGPHDGPQGDMVEGVNAITYGLNIPSSAHKSSITNSCVGCHMQYLWASTDPGLYLAGMATRRT